MRSKNLCRSDAITDYGRKSKQSETEMFAIVKCSQINWVHNCDTGTFEVSFIPSFFPAFLPSFNFFLPIFHFIHSLMQAFDPIFHAMPPFLIPCLNYLPSLPSIPYFLPFVLSFISSIPSFLPPHNYLLIHLLSSLISFFPFSFPPSLLVTFLLSFHHSILPFFPSSIIYRPFDVSRAPHHLFDQPRAIHSPHVISCILVRQPHG